MIIIQINLISHHKLSHASAPARLPALSGGCGVWIAWQSGAAAAGGSLSLSLRGRACGYQFKATAAPSTTTKSPSA